VKNHIIHLDEDQLIRSLLDESDLAVSVQRHLSACSFCQKEKQQFSQKLTRLEEMTKDFAPLPRRKIVLSPEPSFAEKFGFFPLKRVAFSGGFAIVLLIMIGLWWSSPYMTQKQDRQLAKTVEEMNTEEDRQFAKIIEETDAENELPNEIQVLEGYTLPEFYMDVSGESYGYFGEEFLDFVVPLEENSNPAVGSVGFICSSGFHNSTREWI
jgi:hypothetical protein